jgi:cytochrome c oxidase subunit 3
MTFKRQLEKTVLMRGNMMITKRNSTVNSHPFHILDVSQHPITSSLGALGTFSGLVLMMHGFMFGGISCLIGGIMLIITATVWWKDVSREAISGDHTRAVQTGLRLGVLLFIVSEVFFFLTFFWAYFHVSLGPEMAIGGQWPPIGIQTLSAYEVPLLNTAILVSSGGSVTWAHHAIMRGNKRVAVMALFLTVFLGAIFTALQAYEYAETSYTIADSVFGSVFFVATGFHGLHVLVGTIFLCVALGRLINNSLTRDHHVGFETAAWYWHFVDIVWLFLYTWVYWWITI